MCISNTCSKNRHIQRYLFIACIPGNILITLNSSTEQNYFTKDTFYEILQAEGDNDHEMITNIHHFNISENSN